MPCPTHKGKHPCHDARWITTANAQVGRGAYGTNDWHLEEGDLICMMRDHIAAPMANARLIAAAPDLLAALQDISANAAEDYRWIRRKADEAIAKATGESQL